MVSVQQVKNNTIVEGYDKYINSAKKKCNIIEKTLTNDNITINWLNNQTQPYNFKINLGEDNIQINMYLSCVTYLGKPHPKYKKRMQLSNSADRKYLKIANTKNNLTLMIGLYIFDEENPILVAWDVSDNQDAGSSKSSHVYVNDLLLASQFGISQRKDKYNHNVYCFKPKYLKDFIEYNRQYLQHDKTFIEYINEFIEPINAYMFLEDIVDTIKKDLLERDSVWDGKKCLQEMKDSNYKNWKQTEWQGFFLEYLMEKELKKENNKLEQILEIPGPKYGRTKFDSFYNIPWDFKVHVNDSNEIITNDMEAINKGLDDYGKIGFIILSGNAEKETESEFSDWLNELKGGLSKHQIENRKKNKKHRKLKTSFTPKEIKVVIVDKDTLSKHGVLKGLKNPNGNIRRDKLVIKLDKLLPEEIILNEELTN